MGSGTRYGFLEKVESCLISRKVAERWIEWLMQTQHIYRNEKIREE